MDTPVNNSAVAGAVGVTGWALSGLGTSTVGIWYQAITFNPTAPLGPLTFLGNASIVPGSRPDVAGAYPGYPQNNFGWGAQILTNELPNSNGTPSVGNGVYLFHVLARCRWPVK